MTSLEMLGWNPFFESQLDPETDHARTPARVAEEQRGMYVLLAHGREWRAEPAGRLRHEAETEGALLPCVGDWVLATLPGARPEDGVARVERVLDRRSKFSRKEAGNRSAEQVIAANVDTVFLVQSLNGNLNPRRLERYLTLLWESGAEPVVVLSKADLCVDRDAAVAEIEAVAQGAVVHAVSAVEAGGLAALDRYLTEGKTAALVGSSGVGKSTILNTLLGAERMRVREIRADDRGKHTTTARHLVPLPQGGLLIDTPGMRTVLLLESEEGVSRAFGDVESVAAACRFRDCTHQSEPGCAVREAIEDGTLDAARFRSYLKLGREARRMAMKTDARLRDEEKRKWKRRHLEQRNRPDKRKV
ncbi:MAG TPA: ribosome small subunit-dependent GTPase A [Candidatus Eisenbacteria bacterium]|nr:ribosome small subunit-dependent GTPase A [Candidatus Eisenbacteria bacterium]